MTLLLAQRAPRGPGPIMYEHHDLWWVGGMRALFALLIVALLIAGAVLITRMIVNRPTAPRGPAAPPPGPSTEALRILEERFARGEIDETEFRARRDALRS